MHTKHTTERSLFMCACILTLSKHSLGIPVDFNSNDGSHGNALGVAPDNSVRSANAIGRTQVLGSPESNTPQSPTANILVTVLRRSTRFWEPWELNHNVCPPSLCTASDEIRPRGTGGSVFYNGDIVLDKDSEKIIYKNSIRQRWRRTRTKRATNRNSRIWKNGKVPYMFGDIADKSKRVIRKAMKAIENATCIRFRKKRLRDTDYIRYISEPGCWSNVGKVGGEQKLSIGRGCERLGTAIHEIAHSLGFWHEQARPDRDQYVHIIEDNISPRYLPDFEKADPELVTSRGFPYDYESVMHYSKKAFTNLGEVTIKVIGIGKKLNMTIGQREELSVLDIAQLRDMYNCHDKEDDLVTFCPDKWVKKGRSCYKFESELREQFSGAQRHCEDLNSRLLSIDNKNENRIIKKYIKKKFPDVPAWRTGGRVMNGTFVWYKGEKSSDPMDYTDWGKSQPSSYSSLALVYKKAKKRVRWEGVWLGSASQMPDHAYAVICERRSKRKCIPGTHKDGRDNRGKLDHTIDGILCQEWTSQYPHKHNLPTAELSKCIPGTHKDGRDYRGKLDHTIDGILCQEWTSQYPHKHNLPTAKLKGTTKQDRDGLGEHNYCRNPSGERRSRPWCYTNKKNFKWQYCDISICSGSSKPQKVVVETNNNKQTSEKDRNKNTVETDNNRGSTNTNNNNNKNRNDKNKNEITTNDELAGNTSNTLPIEDQYDVPVITDKNSKPKGHKDKKSKKDKKDKKSKKDKKGKKDKHDKPGKGKGRGNKDKSKNRGRGHGRGPKWNRRVRRAPGHIDFGEESRP